MESIFAQYSASISELKRNPSALLDQSNGFAVAILNHNQPTAYLVPAETYEAMLDRLEDRELGEIIEKRVREKPKAVKVALNDL